MNNSYDQIVITAMEGIFPGAKNISDFWDNIITSKVAKVTSLKHQWNRYKSNYLINNGNAQEGTYIESAFLAETGHIIGDDDINRQEKAGKYICEQLRKTIPGENLSRTGLILCAQWAPQSFMEKDCQAYLNSLKIKTANTVEKAYSVEEQIEYIGEGLGGPKLGVDVACASSLYAIVQGITLIESGQSDYALIIGLNLNMSLSIFKAFSHLKALDSKDRIRSYMDDAGGTFFGEAAAGIVLEKRASAIARKVTILGTVKRFGLSCDGADRSIFSPGKRGHQFMLERAYQNTDVIPDYIEGHGTGTNAGDNTEIECLHNFFRDRLPADRKIPLGTAKSIVGHSLAAAGIISVIKALLIIKHKILPPHITGKANQLLQSTCMQLLDRPLPLIKDSEPVRIGISSLGFGGGNAHIILEEFVSQYKAESGNQEKPFYTFFLYDTELQIGEHENPSDCFFDKKKSPFFPVKVNIEARGLRSGPNFLKKIDPLQLFVLDKAHTLLDRNPELKNNTQTSVVMHTNLGGKYFLKLNRRSEILYNQDLEINNEERITLADGAGPKIDNEVLASCLPTMSSGYTALHMNVNGFHMTNSGRMHNFWESMINGLCLAQKQQNPLLIGAARHLKSPLELNPDEKLNEYILWFLFDHNPSHFSSSPLLICHYFPDMSDKSILAAGWNEKDIQQAETAATSFRNKGAELLADFILSDKEKLSVSLSQGENKSVILLEKKRKYIPPARKEIQFPLEIKFDRENFLKDTDKKTIHTGNLTNDIIKQIIEKNEDAMLRFLSLQQKSVKYLVKSENIQKAGIIRSERNRVIEKEQVMSEGVSAALRIDETHPYFFDHQLDHVPGILILEGISQLMELEIKHHQQPHSFSDYYINKFNLRFIKVCSKENTATITIQRLKDGSKSDYYGKVVQNTKAVCVFNLSINSYKVQDKNHSLSERTGIPEMKWLHKQHPENIIVGNLVKENNEISCRILSSPQGHIFTEGHSHWHSSCFALEASRQFFMLLAHQVYEVPLNRPIYLISIELRLEQPIHRHGKLLLQHQLLSVDGLDDTPEFTAKIIQGDKSIGNFTSKALLLKENKSDA